MWSKLVDIIYHLLRLFTPTLQEKKQKNDERLEAEKEKVKETGRPL
jgi:hypothetical protein